MDGWMDDLRTGTGVEYAELSAIVLGLVRQGLQSYHLNTGFYRLQL